MKQHWKKLTATVTALALVLTLLPPVAAQAMAIKAYELVYEPTYQELGSGDYPVIEYRGAVGNTLIVREGVYVTPSGTLSETTIGGEWGAEYLVTLTENKTVDHSAPFLFIDGFNEEGYSIAYDLSERRGVVNTEGWVLDPADYWIGYVSGHYAVARKSVGTDYSGPHKTYGSEAAPYIYAILNLQTGKEVDYTEPNGVLNMTFGGCVGGKEILYGLDENDGYWHYYDLSGEVLFGGRSFGSTYPFSNGYAWVFENGVYSLIDEDGQTKLEFTDTDSYVVEIEMSEDRILKLYDGYVNLNNEYICQRGDFDKYRDETFHPFRNGYAHIDVWESVVEAAYGDALIDAKGNAVIAPADNLQILGDVSKDGYFIAAKVSDNGWEYSNPQLYCLGKTAVLNKATTTVPYSDQLPEGHTYTLSSGSLPAGLTLSGMGQVSGTPTSAGKYKFTVKQDGADLLPCTLTVQEYGIVASGYCGGDTTAQYDSGSGCYKNQQWELDNAGLMTISGTGKMTNIDSMADLPVSSIVVNEGVTGVNGWWLQSFGVKGRTGVKSLALPASLTEIEELDTLCTNLADSLAEIRVADGNNIYCDVDGVLFSKDQKTLLCYPSRKEATSYVIPSTVTSIGARAFDDADKLKSITIPNGVVSIGLCAFDCCDFLENITIPASVTSVGVGAFAHCSLTSIMVEANNTTYSSADGVLFNKATTELIQYPIGNTRTAYTIPSSVTSIDDKAFLGCQNLTSITIPTSVTSIGYGAFAGCSSLTDVYYTGSKEEWKQISIGGWSEPLTSATIHYNSGTPLPNAVKYVPYSTKLASISVNQVQLTYALATGNVLPDGLSLSESGEISGIPTKSGTFTFTVLAKQAPILAAAEGPTSGGVGIRIYQITVQDNSDKNVADAPNVPEGYEITEEVEDMKVTSLSDQVFEIKSYSVEEPTQEEENFGDFMEVYLDGRKLVGGKIEGEITLETIPAEWEYYAEKGSTKITIRAQTFAKAGSGTHTIAAEFREGGAPTGELKTVAQNFKITSTSSGGGGGGAVSTTYKVTAPQTVGGKIAVTPENAKAGDTVTLKVTPDVGYKLSEVAVGDVKLAKVDANTYTFTMPKNKVEIKAAFEKIVSANTTFADIDESAWYFEAARYVYENGLMCGVTEDSFAPGGMMTRAMLLTVLSRYAGADLETTGQNWYVQSVEWAKANGISDGLNPEENITREQVATMLYRYANEPEMVADLSVFGDENSVNAYAAKAVQWAVANGLINGMDGKLAPQAFATRAQLAAIIMRYCENVAK